MLEPRLAGSRLPAAAGSLPGPALLHTLKYPPARYSRDDGGGTARHSTAQLRLAAAGCGNQSRQSSRSRRCGRRRRRGDRRTDGRGEETRAGEVPGGRRRIKEEGEGRDSAWREATGNNENVNKERGETRRRTLWERGSAENFRLRHIGEDRSF